MELIEESAAVLANKRGWFPPEIENDPWVVYHATSSVAEDQIDREGFRCASSGFNDAALLCLSVMETTDWWEDAATATLKAYSLPRIGGAAPFFCALYPQRTSLYTRRDFAGGETAYALRRIIPKLVDLVSNDPEFFARRLEKDRKECIYEAEKGVPFHRKVLDVNMTWLREKVVKLEGFLQQLLGMRDEHRHGVIYALRLDRQDLPQLSYNWSDGLRVYEPLPASKAVAKLIVHGEHDLSSHSDPSWNFDNSWRNKTELALLASKSGRPAGVVDIIDDLELVDPDGARDLRYKLMAEHGDSVLQGFAAKQEEVYRQMLQSAKIAAAQRG